MVNGEEIHGTEGTTSVGLHVNWTGESIAITLDGAEIVVSISPNGSSGFMYSCAADGVVITELNEVLGAGEDVDGYEITVPTCDVIEDEHGKRVVWCVNFMTIALFSKRNAC